MNNRHILILIIFKLFILLPYATYSEEITEITIVSAHWPNYTNQDGTGAYWEIVKSIYEPLGIKVNTHTLPWKRAEWQVVNGQADALLGTYQLGKREAKGMLFPKWHISVEDPIVAVFKKGAFKKFKDGEFTQWQPLGLQNLKGRTVAWIRGYEFDKNLLQGINIVKHVITYPEQALKMVDLERIDAFLDYETTIRETASSANINLERDFDIEIAKTGNKLFVGFAASHKAKALTEIYDQRMDELVKSGVIKNIYKKWGLGTNKF